MVAGAGFVEDPVAEARETADPPQANYEIELEFEALESKTYMDVSPFSQISY